MSVRGQDGVTMTWIKPGPRLDRPRNALLPLTGPSAMITFRPSIGSFGDMAANTVIVLGERTASMA